MKNTIFKAISVISGIVFSLILAELFFRFNPFFGYIHNSFSLNKNEAGTMNVWNSKYYKGFIRPSPLLGYEHEPGQYPYTNKYGMVGKEHPLKKEEGVFRILLLGDSIAEQGWSADELEVLLNNNELLNKKYKFEVWNAGVGSYDVLRYSLFLKNKFNTYNPDMVIVFLFMNDLLVDINCYYKTKDNFTGYHFPVSYLRKAGFPVNSYLMIHSYLYRFFMLQFNGILEKVNKQDKGDNREDNGRIFLGQIKEFCSKNKLDLLFVTFPYLLPLDKYKSYQLKEFNAMDKVVSKIGVDTIELFTFYENLRNSGMNLRFEEHDDIHPSEAVHKLVAQKMHDHIAAKLISKN